MNTKISARQQAILDCIKDKIRTDGYPPSVREIGEIVGLKSSSTVHAHLLQLEEKGLLRRDPTKPRAIIPLDMINDSQIISETLALPVVGDIAAGTPILAEQNIENYLPVPVDFVGAGNHYILRVKGDSMIEAGILDGDYVLVAKQNTARNGDIVVAMVDNDEATVKRFYHEGDHVRLQPENSSMEPFIVKEVLILGKVIGVFRRIY